jgi:hypothetical protein
VSSINTTTPIIANNETTTIIETVSNIGTQTVVENISPSIILPVPYVNVEIVPNPDIM